MNANDVVLWVVVAALAFLLGHGRITLRGTPAPIAQQEEMPAISWRRNDSELLRIYRRYVLRRLVDHYNLDELRVLAFDIGLRHDEIAGETPNSYAMELLEFCERRGLLQPLLAGMVR